MLATALHVLALLWLLLAFQLLPLPLQLHTYCCARVLTLLLLFMHIPQTVLIV
jgi:hypothetical protein